MEECYYIYMTELTTSDLEEDSGAGSLLNKLSAEFITPEMKLKILDHTKESLREAMKTPLQRAKFCRDAGIEEIYTVKDFERMLAGKEQEREDILAEIKVLESVRRESLIDESMAMMG